MADPCLIIFVDGFAYDYLDHAPYLNGLPAKARMVPGLGYSVNQKALLLGPYSPDEAGYFCQWTYDPRSPLRNWAWLFKAMSLFDSDIRISAIAHKAMSRLTGIDLFTIPFKYLSFFSSMRGTEAYTDEFSLPTVLSQRRDELRRVLYRDHSRGPDRDARLFREAQRTIDGDGNPHQLFVASADLDSVGHRNGPCSSATAAKVGELDELIGQTIDRFLNTYPDGRVCVFSDHGMTDIKTYVPVGFEHALGPASESTYLYFLDATLARVWCFSDAVYDTAVQYLDSLGAGKRLTDAERDYYGVASKSFADIIFLFSEGLTPERGFAGGIRTHALHGYDPELASQHGIFMSNSPELLEDSVGPEGRIAARDVADCLAAALSTKALSPRVHHLAGGVEEDRDEPAGQ